MAAAFQCPKCQKKYQFKDQLAGKQVKCQNCGTSFRAPRGISQAPAVAQAATSPPKAAAAPKASPPAAQPAMDDDDLFGADFAAQAPPLGSSDASAGTVLKSTPARGLGTKRPMRPMSDGEQKALSYAGTFLLIGLGALILPSFGLQFYRLRNLGAALPILAVLFCLIGAGLLFFSQRRNLLYAGGSAGGALLALLVAYLISPEIHGDGPGGGPVQPVAGQNFGSSSGQSGRRSDPPRQPEEPEDPDPVKQAIKELASDDRGRQNRGFNRLRDVEPNEQRAEVIAALTPVLDWEGDDFTRKDALKMMAAWDPVAAHPHIIHMLDDKDGGMRRDAIGLLAKSGDPQAAAIIAARLTTEDRGIAVDTLRSMGPEAEDAVLKYLEHNQESVVRDAARILEDIGTERSLPTLKRLHERRTIGGDAESAIEQIERRMSRR